MAAPNYFYSTSWVMTKCHVLGHHVKTYDCIAVYLGLWVRVSRSVGFGVMHDTLFCSTSLTSWSTRCKCGLLGSM